MKNLLMSVCVVLFMAATSQAAILVETVYSDPAPGYVAATVILHTDDAALISAIDMDHSAGRGIVGTLSQKLAGGMFTTPDETYMAFVTPSDWALDTHFPLVATNDLIAVAGSMSESANHLSIIAGIPAADWAASYTLAYVVAPEETKLDVYLYAEVSDSNNSKTVISKQIFPEPATMSLLGLGGLLLARRRRTA